MALAEDLMRKHIDTLAARLDETLANNASTRDRLREALAATVPKKRKAATK